MFDSGSDFASHTGCRFSWVLLALAAAVGAPWTAKQSSIAIVMSQQAGFLQRHDQPFLYVANLIGYVRVVGVIYAFAVADSSIGRCLLIYFLSFACDAVDGKAARAFNQSSRLGAVLDMATDRVATAGLLALLCKFAPAYYLLWILLIMLDVSSHWFQMYVTLAYGEGSHKETGARNPLIKLYYNQRPFMGFCCISCEVLYLAIYAMCHPLAEPITRQAPAPLQAVAHWVASCPATQTADLLPALAIAITLAGCATKQIVNVYQLAGAMQRLAALEMQKEQ